MELRSVLLRTTCKTPEFRIDCLQFRIARVYFSPRLLRPCTLPSSNDQSALWSFRDDYQRVQTIYTVVDSEYHLF